jgi:hypothetical protein
MYPVSPQQIQLRECYNCTRHNVAASKINMPLPLCVSCEVQVRLLKRQMERRTFASAWRNDI